MTVVGMEVVRGDKKEPCLYCGQDEHKTPLACPRIAHVTIEDGCISGISFWEDFYEYEPDLAG
jgi:hypothetical protein